MKITVAQPILCDELVMNKIYLLRGKKVMLDSDLAELYGVQTKALKQAVKRNDSRFHVCINEGRNARFEVTNCDLKTGKWGHKIFAFCFYRTGSSHVVQYTEQR